MKGMSNERNEQRGERATRGTSNERNEQREERALKKATKGQASKDEKAMRRARSNDKESFYIFILFFT